MANPDNAKGLVPFTAGGGAFTGKVNRYVFLAATGTAAYVGGLVALNGGAHTDGTIDVTANVSTGDPVVGVIVSFVSNDQADPPYRKATTLRYVMVADDPDQWFVIQEDSDGGALAVGDMGNVADLTGFTAGSTAYGTSTMEIDTSTKTAAGGGTEDVQILGLLQEVNNEIGNQANIIVRLNNHEYLDANAGN